MNPFRTGADVLVAERIEMLKDRKIGLVVNHTSRLSNGTHILDTMLSLGINIGAIFVPEHGFYGNYERGRSISDSVINKIPLYSLHGKIKKPTKDMLSNVDMIIYDLQDLGVRFYTYVSTLYYVLEAAAETNTPVIVLDRPNPNANANVDGPIPEESYKSFLGLTKIPITYAMTAGELSLLYFHEFISHSYADSLLTVIKMQNWIRDMSWDGTGIEWIPPSPNIPDKETAIVYPGTCFLEGTNISEGRGTGKPFLQIGAPFISSEELLNEMERFNDGTYGLSSISFSPKSLHGKAENPKYENKNCSGVLIKINNYENFNAVRFGVNLIYVLHKLYPKSFRFINEHFDKLAGTDRLRILLQENKTPESIFDSWKDDLKKFNSIRKKYLLY